MVRKKEDRYDASIKLCGRSSQSRSGPSSQSALESMLHESVLVSKVIRACAMPFGSCGLFGHLQSQNTSQQVQQLVLSTGPPWETFFVFHG
mmetsp:Transcript_38760/g.74389  ORF Transcript_38760/g.74389 Transcript_38760/m.74389 type:complete len:91 (-) Transcript_38760:114-386(-)